jgi:hypothetical protein
MRPVLLKLRRFVNAAILFFGCISPIYLFMVWATTSDIYKDYLSATLLARYKTALPGWYVWDVHSCHGEWNVLALAFTLIVIFHLLLLARLILSTVKDYPAASGQGTPAR